MYCGDASTSGNHLARRIGSVCGEPQDRNRRNVYCRVPPLFFFFLRRAIELPIPMLDKNVHPVTVATFSDLSPGTQVHYHISRIIMIELNYRD